ncbi:Hypothetical protein FKW44_019435, partial [Caligus rogercresseyi]
TWKSPGRGGHNKKLDEKKLRDIRQIIEEEAGQGLEKLGHDHLCQEEAPFAFQLHKVAQGQEGKTLVNLRMHNPGL